MFQRRLKIFLAILFAVTLVLALRAAQLQIVKRSEWNEQAIEALKHTTLIETTRGSLRDCKGNVIATDVACIDACVDYRALTDPPDDPWVTNLAQQAIHQRRSLEWRAADVAGRKKILDEERKIVVDRISAMWSTLAQLTGEPIEQIDDVRRDIVRRIETARRYTWYRKYQLAADEHGKRAEDHSTSWWQSWLSGDAADNAPRLDDFDVKVAEQTEAHPIVRAISTNAQNKLGKNIDEFPGLVLRPGMTRSYPYNDVACHVIGSLSRVRPEDIKRDPNAGDELRKYQYTDLIGRGGLEALCEPLLRGRRGRIERYLSDDPAGANVSTDPAQPGIDIAATIDMDLQQQVLSLFQNAKLEFKAGESRTVSVHGGAVLIDLRSNEVRALVSNPTFDLNTLDANYGTLALDNLNRPLLNRATQYPLEPGSTIKPVVGIGAITQGVLGVNEGIECTGYLLVGGKKSGFGRCWVVTKFGSVLGPNGVAHHPIPLAAPHRGHDGNPDGFLTFSDALERSCNVFFETTAHRLGITGLSYWMNQFGLGRPTGIGIGEWRGTLPDTYDGPNADYATYVSGIGQSPVSATAIQMANVAATIARDGTWMRPTLLQHKDTDALRAVDHTSSWTTIPDQVAMKLSPAALAAAHDGMFRVVNSPAGTGTALAEKDSAKRDLKIAGKTGTAEAAPFKLPLLDQAGKFILDERGKHRMEILAPSTAENPNPRAPWYLGFSDDGKNLKHSWIIGYAPAQNPQVAFAVMVEYGGSGGQTAAQIARGMLDAAIEHGYLAPQGATMTTESR